MITIIIAFASLIGLIVLHELGHFILAKKFGVKVEEFGIGIPPRLWGKKFGETLYSINLLPIGAFVKLLGEEENVNDSRSFSKKSIWQRFLIIIGGVVSFWIIAIMNFRSNLANVALKQKTIQNNSKNNDKEKHSGISVRKKLIAIK